MKTTAEPITEVYWLHDDGTRTNLGTMFLWNTGETELRWKIDPADFAGGSIGRVPIGSGAHRAVQAAAGAA